ncbi:MAG TPA: ROK family transcriptional regulator [Paludibacteraceae bacterium]|nr:ROK family transcriptional regulator [Paludibacteraceae bacterium]HOL00024.1 ROK family transcriptional regulator [Paludibacteraceae bacterium]HPO67098.1 ROK family transcriptional regulator [Paludibacteraceae bacterium]
MRYKLIDEIELGSKNALLKINILQYYINNGENSLADLAKEMNLSIPTVSKLVNELIEEGYVIDFGKQETNGGRRPSIYGLNPDSGYFVGVDLKRFRINLALINFKGEMVDSKLSIPFNYENTQESFDTVCKIIDDFVNQLSIPKSKILSVGVNISGRVNTQTGMSYSYYFFKEEPLTEIFQQRLGLHVTIDNDSRAMAYGEFMKGDVKSEKNVLFVNVSWGLGLGIIVDGKLYYGKSGFSGEFGHISAFDNEVLCHCGKKGCLETQASGSYIYRKFIEKVKEGNSSILAGRIKKGESITQEDILEAALNEDMLAIELVEEVGYTLGKHIAGLINLFNPELVIIGGVVAMTGDYLLLPIKSAVKKYSLNLVNKDTTIKLSKLGDLAGVIGACMLARSKMLELI